MMKTRTLAGIVVLLVACSFVAYSQSPVEEFSFVIKDFKMDHQTQTNNLNISISYRYVPNIKKSEYPDFRWLAKDVEMLLSNYPNKDDYWEIVNKQITSLLLNKYPGITSITCDLKVDPTTLVPYTRSSRVTRERTSSKSTRKHVAQKVGPERQRLGPERQRLGPSANGAKYNSQGQARSASPLVSRKKFE